MGFSFSGGSDTAERKIAVYGSEEAFGLPFESPIRVLEIAPLSEKFAEELTHRDYLGAILNLGIDRSLTGDIIVREKRAWLFCLESIAGYLCDSLTRVRHTEVKCRPVSGDIPELAPRLEEKRVNVASERLDAIVAAFTGQSRNHSSSYFTQHLVYVNSSEVTDPSKKLKEGDVLNVRGFGKAIYRGISGESKKGRLYVTLEKYV